MSAAVTQSQSSARRALVTVCAMSATIMQALDTTIANVALPYMQGSLSASLDQVNWVLTSYIVASAVMTAPIGWLANRYGRKKLFVICVAGFTVASVLCSVAQSIDQMVLYRLLQGMCGAALVPLSQSLMLDAYPAEQRGQAMAIWGMGVMLGPIMGPTLGAWLTDTYSWHWVFLINLPIGIVTVLGLIAFMDETEHQRHLRFDWFGFIALSVGIGSLQLMLDRGEQLGWFDSPEIIAEAIVSIVGFYFFFAHSLTTDNPFIRFELFKDRSFVGATIFMVVIGLVLFATMALLTPFMQVLLGYPILTSGILLGTRGVGTLFAMMAVGWLLRFIEARTLVGIGLLITAATLYQMVGFTNDTSPNTIVVVGIIQGVGLGLVFVPLSTVAFVTLPAHLRTEGSAMLTLVRNVGSSIGISVVIANLTNTTTYMHARLTEYVTPFNNALQMPDVAGTLNLGTDMGRAMLDQIVTTQAMVISYSNDFLFLMWLTLASVPLVFIIGSSRPLRSLLPGGGGSRRAPQHDAADRVNPPTLRLP
jgi:DHA2 family multidrug resistance protein